MRVILLYARAGDRINCIAAEDEDLTVAQYFLCYRTGLFNSLNSALITIL